MPDQDDDQDDDDEQKQTFMNAVISPFIIYIPKSKQERFIEYLFSSDCGIRPHAMGKFAYQNDFTKIVLLMGVISTFSNYIQSSPYNTIFSTFST